MRYRFHDLVQLFGAEQAAAEPAQEVTTTVITSLLSSPFAARNEFGGWQRTHEVALRAARGRGNRRAEAVLLAGLGQLRYEQDDFDSALRNFEQAAEIATEIDDSSTLAVAYVGMGTVRRDLAEFTVARELLDRTIVLGDDGVVAAASYGVGAIHRDNGDLEEATLAFARCVELYRSLDDQRGKALALRGSSLCHRAAGAFAEAVTLSRDAERILRLAGDELGATYAAQSWAKASLRAGEVDGVDDLLASCLEVCTQQHDRFGVALMTRTMGESALAQGREEAVGLLTDALAQWTSLGLPIWRARAMRDLAAATDDDQMFAQARKLFARLGAREAGELAGLTASEWGATVRR